MSVALESFLNLLLSLFYPFHTTDQSIRPLVTMEVTVVHQLLDLTTVFC